MVPRLWVKLHTSAEYKIYSNSRAHGIERVMVWSHNLHFFWGWLGWRELFWKSVRQLCRVLRQMRSPVATFKILDPVWINPTGYKRIVFRKTLFQNKPMHENLLSAN